MPLLLLACASKRGPRDVGNLNPPSRFADGPGAAAGARDVGGEPARVAAAPSVAGRAPRELVRAETSALATSRTHVYYGDREDDALYALPKAGGPPVRVARRAPSAHALAFDADTLAWIGTPGDVVLRVSTTAPAATPSTVRENGIFTDVATSRGDVFLTEARGGAGILTRVTGNTAAHLASIEEAPRGLAVDGDHVYLATSAGLLATTRNRGEVKRLATGAAFANPQLDDAWLYATAADPGARTRRLVRVPKTGGPLETIATNVRDGAIAVSGGLVYWLDAERPAVLAATTATPRTAKVVSEDGSFEQVDALAVDDDGIFVATGRSDGARIVVVPTK